MTISTLAAVIITILASTCMAKDVLLMREELKEGESLDAGDYKLIMQQDHCNLVLYDKQAPIWISNTAVQGKKGCKAKLTSSGDLTIDDIHGETVYNSHGDYCCGEFVLVLQKDRNLVIYGDAIWATGTAKDKVDGGVVVSAMNNGAILASTAVGDVLLSGEVLKDEGEEFLELGNYRFVMEDNCKLSLYDGPVPLWISNTGELGKTGCFAEMTHYGYLATFDRDHRIVYATHTSGSYGNYALVLQKDRNLVMYGPFNWSTGTGIKKVGVANMNGTVDHDGGSSARTRLQNNTTAALGDVHDQLQFAAASAAAAAA